MEWIKGMILQDYAIGLLRESSRRHGRGRITMAEAMKEARMARKFYILEQAFLATEKESGTLYHDRGHPDRSPYT